MTPEQLKLVEKFIDEKSSVVALKTGDAIVAAAVDALQNERKKLPSYFNARIVVDKISFQQSTSEQVAQSRNFPGGSLAIDLTMGLGVDSLYLSKIYDKVISVEIDPSKAATAKLNFQTLGANNIEVICSSAEEFIAGFDGVADLVFIDPARRGDKGQKVHALQDCAPNIIEIMPRVNEISQSVAVKLSPLFDVAELFNIFGDNIEVETVSVKGECKDVVMKMGAIARPEILSLTVLKNSGDSPVRLAFSAEKTKLNGTLELCDAKYIHVPDVTFVKSRTTGKYMSQSYPNFTYLIGSHLFTAEKLADFIGRSFKISEVGEYNPKSLKRMLGELGIKTATLYHRDFPYSSELLYKKLGLKEGSDCSLFFGRAAGELYFAISLK